MSKTIPLFTLWLMLLACQPTNQQNQQSVQDSSDTTTVAEAPLKVMVFDSSLYEFQDGAIVLGWPTLAKVSFNDQYNEELETYISYPLFSAEVQALDGQEVIVNGYVIPLEETGEDILVLSAFPFSSCFFCGGAGPESVMDIKLKNPGDKRYKTDQITRFRGKLRLNDSDLYYLNYILEEAVAL
ncbi:MAG TPA: hypothetical protein PKA00_19750 [Saprospiraceae bacterium]|nr:hypothetical protein [Saprospiraceae bacterium]HMQ85154.1 hypothetical protein [Saprospiraceae bacterium]